MRDPSTSERERVNMTIFLSLKRNHCTYFAQNVIIPSLGADIHYFLGLGKWLQ